MLRAFIGLYFAKEKINETCCSHSRPANVGKSTLFNRLIGERHAIVEDTPGVTRDRLYRDTYWLDKEFTIIDTGGIEFKKDDGSIFAKVKEQAALAIEEAQVIIFLVDGKTGVTADDEEVAAILRKAINRLSWPSIRSIISRTILLFMIFTLWVWGSRSRFLRFMA